ncbi:transcription factor bHLH68-like [Silene latifolia]|uniref:transcription factor bHLH68-like n=1 Tax=Silene latifolia TaxID=37657 RepID=UPI003D76DF10
MNKGVLQNNSPVQQMIASVNPSLWNINNLIKPPFISSSPSSSSSSIITNNFLAPPPYSSNNNINDVIISHNNHSFNNNNNNLMQANQHSMNMSTTSSSWLLDDDHQQNLPFHGSWSQLLLGGLLMGEEAKRMENWEEQLLLQQHHNTLVDHVKQESSVNSYINTNNNNINNNTNNNVYITHNNDNNQEFQLAANWSSQQISNIPASSPQSCVTTTINNTNMLDFSSKCANDNLHPRPNNNPVHFQDHSSECTTGGVQKKAKVQPSASQSTFKVRKEKLGDRITALHQLVSPFGKTDTASVLLEAIGYIRFLQSQVEALSLPYLTNGAGSKKQPHTGEGERKCIFPEDPGQLLNENSLKRKGGPVQELHEEAKDLRSKGLCLVPISCTMHVGSDNGADYWAPAFGGGFR